MWSKKEVAQYLNVSLRQVDVLREKHGLPFRKIGGLVRFYPAEVEAWVQQK
ncbi:MAG: helix-turn-helix domain-containing protein [Thermoguttaceae bacterium]|jgi:excisionase family DNA binding protein|nr:helix-turn-helix domain-containing protein [Thermoguttaceae bacterium]